MAPEQLEGKDVDTRTDIFAFGAVLYEMLTGRKAFEGKSQASLIGAIMNSEPQPVSELQLVSPRSLDWAVKRCLAKDPDDRWQSARDLMAELGRIAEGSSEAGLSAPTTDGGGRARFFSPDGQWIGFWANGRLQKVSVTGGLPVTVCDCESMRGGVGEPTTSLCSGLGRADCFKYPQAEARRCLSPHRAQASPIAGHKSYQAERP